MKSYIITYDLNKSGQNYEELIGKIKQYGTWCHLQGSVWVIKTSQTSTQIRDTLSSAADNNDTIFVAALTGEAAWLGLTDDQSNWFKEVA